MELDHETKRRVWWQGTIKGAVRGLFFGLIAGAATALILQFALIPLFPVIGPAFAGFLTLSPGVAGAAFSPVPLAIFSGLSGMLGNALANGKIACNAYKQEVEHRMNEERIDAIEVREQALEQTITPSHAVRQALAKGPRAS